MEPVIFISHSSKDKAIVSQLADLLRQENVWFDAWDIDLGDILADKIEIGIDNAKTFLIILSKNSISSRWVRYELNMALIKYLENENYKIVIARIDDVDVPLRLRPFLRIDVGQNSDIASSIARYLTANDVTSQRAFKRQFVNRAVEISSLSDILYDGDTKFISIVGFFGIGKTSLVREVLKRVYSNPQIIEFNLSQAHFGVRLTIELCSKAGIPIPSEGLSTGEMLQINLLALEKMIAEDHFIIFNKFDEVLDDDGIPIKDYIEIFKHFDESQALINRPFIVISRRWPKFRNLLRKAISTFKVSGLSPKHLAQILKSEIERVDTTVSIDNDKIIRLADSLHGYPLAGRLAAPLIVKYGIDYLFDNLHLIQQLKIDIAEDIIAKLNLTSNQLDILEILAIFESPLSTFYLASLLEIETEELIQDIDSLANSNLIESSSIGLVLHPLVNDFYLKLAKSNQNFLNFALKLSQIALAEFKKLSVTDHNYVFWLTTACRLLFYSGKYNEGRQLRKDLIGELKLAAIRLYQRQEYSSSLDFCNEFLIEMPDDKEVKFYKARALSRLGRIQEAIKILNELIEHEKSKFLLSKYHYGLGRSYIENSHNDNSSLRHASKHFLQSIRINEHQAALQSMAELLYKQDKFQEAESFILRKLEITPADPFALSIYADIQWQMGNKADAISNIMESIKHQPKNPNFWFRAGRFLQELDRLEDAYTYFKNAIRYDDGYLDAKLSLADICLDLGKMDEAKSILNHLEQKIKGEKKSILESIKANFELKNKNLVDAEKIADKLLKEARNSHNLGLMAKIYIQKHRDAMNKSLIIYAETYKVKALDLINEGLSKEVNNDILLKMKKAISQ